MIDAKHVQEILLDSLFRDAELNETRTGPKDGTEVVKVRGILHNLGFHKNRLESHRQEIVAYLNELPDQFHRGKGDGWSFLNACMTKDGIQWGEHRDMEALFCLGIGLGIVRWQLPREMWSMFPGGMPYVVVDTEVKNEV